MLELKATFDFDLYLLEPGDEIFIPSGIMPNHPQRTLPYPRTQQQKKTLSYSTIQLSKQSQLQHSPSCNGTKGYVYGGKTSNNM